MDFSPPQNKQSTEIVGVILRCLALVDSLSSIASHEKKECLGLDS